MTASWTLVQKEDTADSCLEALTLMQVPAGVRKEQELRDSPAFAAPLLVTQACKAPMYRTTLAFLKY